MAAYEEFRRCLKDGELDRARALIPEVQKIEVHDPEIPEFLDIQRLNRDHKKTCEALVIWCIYRPQDIPLLRKHFHSQISSLTLLEVEDPEYEKSLHRFLDEDLRRFSKDLYGFMLERSVDNALTHLERLHAVVPSGEFSLALEEAFKRFGSDEIGYYWKIAERFGFYHPRY